jgi:23S rRNA (uracil1939-C5)-methyltransferase
MGKQIEVDIIDLAFDGKAVAHNDGKVVFLDAGLPGERVTAEITRSKPRHDQARVLNIIKKSSDRAEAPCEHFGGCGGCAWQDLSYERQLHYKTKQVGDCMERLAGLPDVKVRETIPAPDQFRYRNKMEFSFHTATDESFTLGLHRRGAFDEVFDLKACYLQSELANEIVATVRQFVRDYSLPVYDVIKHTGYARFLVIRETTFTDQVMVNFVSNYGELEKGEELVAVLTALSPRITTVVHNQNGQKSNIATGEIEKVLSGSGSIQEKILVKVFRIKANSFFQTNSAQTETLYRTAFDMLSLGGDDRVLDLYCGTGPIGILLSERVKEVVGVELVTDAVVMARENAAANDISNITFIESNVVEYLRNQAPEGDPFDAVVIDPPRAGLHPKALRSIKEMKPPRILYISCNPATFARDAKELVAIGYELPEVRPIDMFPHTRHIELVSVFSQS